MSIEAAPDFDQLTPREQEVCALLMMGLSTNAALSRALILSDNTVHSHVSSLLRKFRAIDRTQLVSTAWRYGTIVDHRWMPTT